MKNSDKKEKILLDATLEYEVDSPTFRARLENGHVFSAFPSAEIKASEERLSVGDNVHVCFSPFDMSKAMIIGRF